MRFAPGRGNLKLLVLNPDSVSIWDIRECELINELRTPKDMVRVADIEWAASDRAVLATVDGCLRVMGLSLASASSAMYDYSQEEPMACHSLLGNKPRDNFHVLLHHQPWREKFALRDLGATDGFSSASDLEFVHEQIRFIPPEVLDRLEVEGTSTAERCLIASQLVGSQWETDFWRIALAAFDKSGKSELDPSHDLACDTASYTRYQLERVHLHETRSASHAQRRRVIDLMLCLGQKDEAVRLLLETEPDNPGYIEDNLKACLVASTAVSERGTPHSTTKLVATNLIAEGKLWEGVQLLCLIDKVPDACSYLQSCGQWDASLWLAKVRLSDADYAKVASKYAEHALARDLKKRAVTVLLSVGDFVSVLDTLLKAKMVPLAALFKEALAERKLLPDTSHVMVLSEEIALSYARHLFDCGNQSGAFHYCDQGDEKGEILRLELEALSSAGKKTEEPETKAEDAEIEE